MQTGLNFGADGKFSHDHEDVVFTPPDVAEAIVRHFAPTGKLLDPCRGDGAFWRHMPGADYCELQEGKDFFEYEKQVDWIVSNPPYSCFSKWLQHSFEIAENIVYLIPINKAFNSSSMLQATYEWGGIAEIVHIGPGSKLRFPVGFAMGAIHYKRAWSGGILYRHGFLSKGTETIEMSNEVDQHRKQIEMKCPVCWQEIEVCRSLSTDPDATLPVPEGADYLTRRIREHWGCCWFNNART